MKRSVMILFGLLNFIFSKSQSIYDSYPVYKGSDQGLTYSSAFSLFRIWAPTAEKAQIIFYNAGDGGESTGFLNMIKDLNGTWTAKVAGDIKGQFYVFKVQINGKWLNEVPDPYAKAVGVNGRRAMVVDLRITNPPGWEKDKSPSF